MEWSSRADFSNVCGSREVAATGTLGTRVLAAGLTRGRRYFFRAAAGNVKGWGPFTVSLPRSVVPSSKYAAVSTCICMLNICLKMVIATEKPLLALVGPAALIKINSSDASSWSRL